MAPFRLTDAARRRAADEEAALNPDFDRAAFLAMQFDDGSAPYDRQAEFCTLLRSTLFRLPLNRVDFPSVAHVLVSLRSTDITPIELAAHMHDSSLTFIADVLQPDLVPRVSDNNSEDADGSEPALRLRFDDIDSEDVAREWIDIIGFDRRFASSVWREASADYRVRRHSVQKPRIYERALQRGFDRIHRKVFGLQMAAADARAPIHSNPTRIPQTNRRSELTRVWTEVAPFRQPQAELSLASIGRK